MAPFYGWGSTASRLQSDLLFITKFSEIPPSGFEHGTPGNNIQVFVLTFWSCTDNEVW